jgi:hypothetical protein
MKHRNKVTGWLLSSQKAETYQTVLVIGHERSGTSMIAGTLHSLGVFMGEMFTAPVFEDEKLGNTIKKKGAIKEVIKGYNEKNKIWGFKKPSCNVQIIKKIKLFQKPLVIYISRDSISVALRCSHVYDRDFYKELSLVEKNQSNLTKIIGGLKGTDVLYCSYEKIINKPVEFVKQLESILKLNSSEEQFKNAIQFIAPEPVAYLNVSEPMLNYRGYIDSINGNMITGWITNRKKTSEEVQLAVFINGKSICFERIDIMRQDILDLKWHPDGMCGFHLKIDNITITNSDQVQVKVAGDEYLVSQSSGFIRS